MIHSMVSRLPKGMHKEFADVIQAISEKQVRLRLSRSWMSAQEKLQRKRVRTDPFRKCQITEAETIPSFSTLAKVRYTDHGVEKV